MATKAQLKVPAGMQRLCRRMITAPSRPEEFHPEPLTGPDVSLSTYPARTAH
jgi:hypothetical protein